jgi:DKNYY family
MESSNFYMIFRRLAIFAIMIVTAVGIFHFAYHHFTNDLHPNSYLSKLRPQTRPRTYEPLNYQSATTTAHDLSLPQQIKEPFKWAHISSEPNYFSQKSNRIYFDGVPFSPDVDASTLVVALKDSSLAPYAKDGKRIYYVDDFQLPDNDGKFTTTIPVLTSADPGTFTVLYSNSDYGQNISYAIDKYHLFRNDVAIGSTSAIDLASFKFNNDDPPLYATDNIHVFNVMCYKQPLTPYFIVPLADSQTFRPLYTAVPYLYAVDKTHVFVAGSDCWSVLPDADAHTFSVLGDGEYSKDRSHVWVFGTLVSRADPATFVITNQPGIDATDAMHSYNNGTIVK